MSNRIQGVVRDNVTGAGQSGVTVTVKLVSDGSTVTSTTSDAGDAGFFSRTVEQVGHPGPVREEYTYSATTKKRDGRVYGQLAGMLWADSVDDVFELLGIGVSTGLEVTASGGSMSPSISAGFALLKDGLPYIQESAKTVTITTADGSNPRIDRIVLRLTREGQTDQGKIALVAIAGTPAASPTAPNITQTSATWDFSLAQVLVGAGVSAIAADKVTDERTLITPLDLKAPIASPTFTGTATIPNLVVTGNTSVGGPLTVDGNTTLGNASATDGVTIVGTLAAAGSSPTLSVVGADIGTTGTATLEFGNDVRGVIKVTPGGTGITAGVLCTLSFFQTKANADYVVTFSRQDSDAPALNLYVNQPTQTVNSVSFRTTNAPTTGTEYRVGYVIID